MSMTGRFLKYLLPVFVLGVSLSVLGQGVETVEENCPVPEPQTARKILVFGSDAILRSCWPAEQLRNPGASKKTVKTARNTKPPERLMPKNILPHLAPELQNSIRHVNPHDDQKVVALTFDLCERADEITGYDAAIVNYLRAKGVKATFFIGGKWMLDHPDKTMQLMADPLFEVGSHAWTHADLRLEKGIKMDEQILWTQAQYELLREQMLARPCAANFSDAEKEKIPLIPYTFRFPYGVCSRDALQFLTQFGLPAIQWSLVTADPSKKRLPQDIARVVLKRVRPGDIIICHANGQGAGTSAALPLFLPKLRNLGYEFVTVSELLSYGPAFSMEDCYELRVGDNLDYDRIYGRKK